MTRKIPNVRVRGIRQRIPFGYMIGRGDKGDGPAQLLSPADQRRLLGLTPGEVVGAVGAVMPPSIGFMALGSIDDGEWLGQLVFTRGITFPVNFALAQGFAGQLATATTVFTVKKFAGGVTTTVGTITWTAGVEDATFATTGGLAQTFVAGDVVRFYGASPPDATLRDIAVTIPGSVT
jgi:hypothetical protein